MISSIALATIGMDRMAGGLERNIMYLANHLAEKGERVLLLTFDRPEATAFYDLDSRVTWCRLGRSAPHGRISFRERLALILRIRHVLKAQDVATLVCFHHGILARFLLGGLGLGIRVICSERNALTIYDHVRANKWNLNFLLLALTDAITVQFPTYAAQYPRWLRRRIHVVHNPVCPAPQRSNAERQPVILSIGRHAAQKRFDLLVEAFGRLAERWPDWRLVIIGDGPLLPDLQADVAQRGLGARVSLLPVSRDLQQHFARARIYCQPSQWEGFPNAQAEAMAAGVIPVGFAVTSGVADLIEPGWNGVLAAGTPTAEGLATALESVMAAPQDWSAMSDAARQVAVTYSVAAWREKWDKLLAEWRSSR